MRKSIAILTVLIGFSTVVAARADADPITFDGQSGIVDSYSESGVTFTAVMGPLRFDETPNGTIGLLTIPSADDIFPQMRAVIAGGTSSVSVDLGDFGQDDDLLVLRGYDSAGDLVGFTSLFIRDTIEGMRTLSLSRNRPDIASVAFGAETAFGGSSVYADNFTFGNSAPIPEPTSLILLTTGLLVGAVREWRRRTTRNSP